MFNGCSLCVLWVSVSHHMSTWGQYEVVVHLWSLQQQCSVAGHAAGPSVLFSRQSPWIAQ